VAIHEDDVFAGFGRAWMEFFVIKKERGRFRRKTENHVGRLSRGSIDHDAQEDICGSGLVDAFAVGFRVPFIAGSLRFEEIDR
jgi:hypothetical protein